MFVRLMQAACLAGAMAVTTARAADEPSAGVVVQWIASPADQATWAADLHSRLKTRLGAAVRSAVAGPVILADAPLAQSDLMLGLRELPAALAAAGLASRGRYVLCLQLSRLDDEVGAEVAICDTARGTLASYKALQFAPDELELGLPEAVGALVRGALPGARRATTRPLAAPSGDEPLRDAPLPDFGLHGDQHLWSAVAVESLAAGSTGEAAGPIRLKATSQRVELRRAGGEQTETMEVSVWHAGDETQVELLFSDALPSYTIPRRGAWVAVDLEGVQVQSQPTIEVNRSGLVQISLKRLDEGFGTRIGFELTDAGQVRLAAYDRGRRLVASIEKDAPAAGLLAGAANAQALPSGEYSIVRRFSGTASWYGGRFHGRRTASGEPFDQNRFTAAHRTLPLGTWVRVTNAGNGRSAVVRINDRGPWSHGRVIDVSAACARALQFIGSGTARVTVDVLRRMS